LISSKATVAASPPHVTVPGRNGASHGPIAQDAKPAVHRGGPYADPDDPCLVTFYLTAPFKPAISLVGDFNGWNPHSHPMESDGKGLFWIQVRLQGPIHYRFCVTLDGSGKQVTVADPYAREVRWDAAGPKGFYAPGRQCHRTHAHHRVPGRQLLGLQPGLLHGAQVGLWQAKRAEGLIDACHERGIAVILDMVFNHAWPDQPYHRMYPPLFGPKGEMLEDRNPSSTITTTATRTRGAGWTGSTHRPWVVGYMQDIVRFWLDEYSVDGFRFDWLGGVEYDPWQPHKARTSTRSRAWRPLPARRARRAPLLPHRRVLADPRHEPEQDRGPLVQAKPRSTRCGTALFTTASRACLFETWQWERRTCRMCWAGSAAGI
jgi:1,4-alpha-glucan branching enzyme